MKLGLVSAILGELDFESMIDVVADMGYQCVEAACWPSGKAERRYAGVTHIDVQKMDERKKESIIKYCSEKGVEISALAFYPNTLDPDLEKRRENIEHLKKVIKAAQLLEVGMVTTFVGRDQTKTVEDNLQIFEETWGGILECAQENRVKVAIENCPMLFGSEQWPGGQNLAVSPKIWRRMFEIFPSQYFGLNYDPSHFVWQKMDYIKPIYEFKDRIFHVHFKDIKIYPDRLDDVGVMAYPLEYMAPKLPGLGDVKWGQFVSALTDIGYDGYACIEVEDRSFEENMEEVKKSLILSKRYMEQFVV